ncbi:hypothetical protein CRV24_006420 [Beauveria bassiana]|nr:hypothetical protein CRV24_006420 [Beauveria bassiana]
MAPFYGQGMNAGMEGVRLLFPCWISTRMRQGRLCAVNKVKTTKTTTLPAGLRKFVGGHWRSTPPAAGGMPTPSTTWRCRTTEKREHLSPRCTSFARLWRDSCTPLLRLSDGKASIRGVVFSNEPYAECVRRNDRQDRLLSIFTALCAGPFVAAGLYSLWSAVTAPWQWPGFRRHVLSVALGV